MRSGGIYRFVLLAALVAAMVWIWSVRDMLDSETLELKMQSVQCYETQFPPEKKLFLRRLEGHALQVGASAGYAAGEMFVSARIVGAPDLPHSHGD